jgi:hypothetical protein
MVEIELKPKNVPIYKLLTSDIITDIDVKKSMKIKDDEIAIIVGKDMCNNNNIDDLIEMKKIELSMINNDLEILTAESEKIK